MRWMRRMPLRTLGALLVVGTALAACGSGTTADRNTLRGTTLVVFGAWSGIEQRRFLEVLSVFSAATGARVNYVSANGRYMPDVIDAWTARGEPPDVALLPQPGLLRHYAEVDRLVPLDGTTAADAVEHYAGIWRSLASWNGQQYGIWFKAANKSLVWYDVGTFERAGVVPPDDLSGLLRVARVLRREEVAPFAVAGYDGWTLTDWFENIYLRIAGPTKYDALAAHRMPWTDPSVCRALSVMGRLLAPANLLGGPAEALRTSFEASVPQAFGPPPRAAMLAEGDFVAGFIKSGTGIRVGADVDAFPFPGGYAGLPVVVGGGDVAVQMSAGRAPAELLSFLASPAAAEVWAARGGYISPNLDVDLSVYPDALSRALARQVIEAGSGFRFDLSDLQPAEFGSAPWSGMQGALRRFLRDGEVSAAQRRLEAAAEKAGLR